MKEKRKIILPLRTILASCYEHIFEEVGENDGTDGVDLISQLVLENKNNLFNYFIISEKEN